MISISEFRRRVASLDGQRLETDSQRRGFTVRVTGKGLEYTPESSGKSRLHTWQRIERVLGRYDEIRSLSPARYRDISLHGSYLTTILRRLFPAGGTGA